MKLPRFILPLLLASALLMTGCDKDNEEASASETESMSASDVSGDNENENSSQTPEPPAESTIIVPVEFSDEDLELQQLLADMQQPTEEIIHWYYGMVPPPKSLDFAFPQFGGDAVTQYARIPDNFRARDDISPFVMPVTRSEMKNIMLQYFSGECTERFISKISTASMTRNSDGSYTVNFTDGSEQNLGGLYPTFIEIGGRLYHFNVIRPISLYIDHESAKITEKTDDTIKFSYLHYSSKPEFDTKFRFEPLYSENALTGVLKYERGGWKLDYWE